MSIRKSGIILERRKSMDTSSGRRASTELLIQGSKVAPELLKIAGTVTTENVIQGIKEEEQRVSTAVQALWVEKLVKPASPPRPHRGVVGEEKTVSTDKAKFYINLCKGCHWILSIGLLSLFIASNIKGSVIQNALKLDTPQSKEVKILNLTVTEMELNLMMDRHLVPTQV